MSEVDEVIPKKGGYESRVEQYLYEHPSVPITISKAGRNPEGNGTYIVYTIKVKVGFFLSFIRFPIRSILMLTIYFRKLNANGGTRSFFLFVRLW